MANIKTNATGDFQALFEPKPVGDFVIGFG
jgi:hypothetical protein